MTTDPARPVYRVYLNDELMAKTDWLPLAVAAWDRASRDRDSAQHGGVAVLQRDGAVIASEQPRTGAGHPWPDAATREPDLRDLAAAIQMLTKVAGVDARTLADAATELGLPTTRGRLDGIRTQQDGKRAHVSAAELVVLCYAAIHAIKSNESR